MATLKTFLRGESVTINFLFPDDYTLENILETKVYLGSKLVANERNDELVSCKLSSNDTKDFGTINKLTFWLHDSVLGVQKVYVGDVCFDGTNAIAANDGIREAIDIVVPLEISESEIIVGDIVYNYVKGEQGDSAYTVAVNNGFVGTEAEWLLSLNGTDGKNAYEVAVEQGYTGTVSEWLTSLNGLDGADGYTPYIQGGYWFINGITTGIKATGENGANGIDGTDGIDGIDGNGIVSITLQSTVGLIKTYRILFTNATTFDYDVTDGLNGTNGTNGIDGQDGADGLTVSVNNVVQVDGNITLTKSDIGLGNVDNTSDEDKPISTEQQYEFDLKAMQNPGICQKCPITANDIVIDYTALTLTIATVKNGEAISELNPIRFFTDGNGIITKWEKSAPVVFTFTNLSGVWFFHFDNTGTPIATQTPWTDFNTIATVYRILWNNTLVGSARSIGEALETHLNDTSAADHAWKHAQGSIWVSGGDAVSTLLANTNGVPTSAPNADGRNTVISLTSCKVSDDGLEYTSKNSTDGLKFSQDLGHLTSATLNATNSGLFQIRIQIGGLSEVLPATRFPFAWDIATNRPQYITGAGVRTLVADNRWFVYYLYQIQDPRNGSQIRLVSEITEFASWTAAQASTWDILKTSITAIQDNEIRPLQKLIFYNNHTGGAYNVGCKFSALVSIDNYRTTRVASVGTAVGSILASNAIVTPTATLLSTNAQSAFEELDTEKANLSGGNSLFGKQSIQNDNADNTLNILETKNFSGVLKSSINGNGNYDTFADYGSEEAPTVYDAANWTLSVGWTFNGNALDKSSNGTTAVNAIGGNDTATGSVYKVQFTVANSIATGTFVGNFQITMAGMTFPTISAIGTYTFYVHANLNTKIFFTPTASGSRFSISNISMTKRVDTTADITVGGDLFLLGNRIKNKSTNGVLLFWSPSGAITTQAPWTFTSTLTSNNTITARQLATVTGNSSNSSGSVTWTLTSNGDFRLTTPLTGAVTMNITTTPLAGASSVLSLIQGSTIQSLTLSFTGVTFRQTGTTNSSANTITLQGLTSVNAHYVVVLYWRSATECFVTVTTSIFDYDSIALSNNGADATDLSVGVKLTETVKFAETWHDIASSVATAPTGGTLIMDVKKNGTSIFSTLVSIDATETTSVTAATPYVMSTNPTFWAVGDVREYSVTQVGAVVAGKGLITTVKKTT